MPNRTKLHGGLPKGNKPHARHQVHPDPARLRRAFAAFVLTMASFILVREGTLVASTAGEALPQTIPQLVFAAVMLGVGLWTGRATRRAEQAVWDPDFEQGEGI